jgi:hypothetical protein
MKFKIYTTKNKYIKSTLAFLAMLMLSSFIPITVLASDNQEAVYINLETLGFDIHIDSREYHLEYLDLEDLEYLEQNIFLISEYEFLDLQDEKVFLEEVILDEDHTFILYEYEDNNGYIGIGATIIFTKVAIATFVAFKNPVVLTRLKSVVSSATMNAMTDSRASAVRSAIRNQTFGSNQALQDTVMRRMVNTGMTSAQARAIGLGVSQLVR